MTIDTPHGVTPAEPTVRELRFSIPEQVLRRYGGWIVDIHATLKAQRTTRQPPPYRPISLFGWVP